MDTSHEGQLEKGNERTQASILQSQILLFKSRKKWGVLYSLATVAGLFCVPGVLPAMAAEGNVLLLLQQVVPLPLISLLIATGMYILNDLVDADLDRANGKSRPIPSGRVSKRQAWTFVMTTNGLAVLLSVATLNLASMLIVVPMLLIGILYSAPKIALMNRFVLKTLSIAIFYGLCALLGITSTYGISLALTAPAAPIHAMTVLAIMIFISSTLNDLGDVEGDRAAGRRTIPIVIGSNSAIRLLLVLSAAMPAVSWGLYGAVSTVTVVLTSIFALIVLTGLLKIKGGLKKIDTEAMRRQHKKLFPLHVVLQTFVAAGAAFAFV
ncbi:MAG: UbiA prenyltransferase family protein, partial [Nitrososphaera sp.]